MEYVLNKDTLINLPLFHFTGKIHFASTLKESDSILSFLQDEQILGFDTETKPSFKKGEHHPIALLQLASQDHVCLFAISKTGIPSRLKYILQNEKILKIGQEPGYEINKLNEEHGVKVKGIIDLVSLAKQWKCSPLNLKSLAAIFLKIRISKSARTSNWENPVLTRKQLLYAATDAWVCRQIYLEMLKLPSINPPSHQQKA
ncbi:MAG: 3'-5' exonuclease domain-containing protein 2 [Candidatus Aureabacteria bacterium]|nr:3'-5' exonuclease domain-containing protein 2 [Candidatus Auribacterota bacterium]